MYRTILPAILVLLFSAQGVARGQAASSNLTGVVTDVAGRPLSDVLVDAEHLQSGYHYATSSRSTGRYFLGGLPPGRYRMSARRIGYRRVVRSTAIHIGEKVSADFILAEEITPMEPITVTAVAPASVSPKVSHVMDRDRIVGLPEASRQFIELARLTPGATEGTASTGGPPLFGTNGISIGGLNRQSLGIRIDGGDFTGGLFGDLAASLPLLAVQEFEVVQSQYSAEFGRTASGVINVVTRRGSNRTQVEALGLFRHHTLNARGPFEESRPDFNRMHWGLAVSGPIIRNRTHLFAAIEQRVQNNFSTVNTGGVFPDEEGTFKTPFSDHLMHIRLDHRLTGTHELMLRYAGEIGEQVIGVGGRRSLSYGRTNTLNTHSWLVAHRASLERGMLLESRLHVITARKSLLRNSDGGPTLVYPGLVTGPHESEERSRSTRLEILSSMSWIGDGWTGTHRVKVGTQISWLQNFTRSSFFENGLFRFASDSATEPLLARISLRDPAVRLDARNTQLAFYIQDDWFPSTRLSISIGARYDVETNGTNQGFVSPYVDDLPFIPSSPRPVDRNNVAPRLGLVWDVSGDGTTVIRSGFGLFFDQTVAGPQLALERSSGVPFATIPYPETTVVDDLVSDPNEIPPIIWTADELSTPMTRQYSLGIEQSLPFGLALRLDGLLVQGRNLLMMRNLNPVVDGQPRIPGFSRVTQMLSRGRADARLLLAQLTRRWGSGWMEVGYTLSHRDNTNDTFGMPLVPDTDPSEFSPEDHRAPAAWDERHRLVAIGTIELPFSLSLSARVLFRSPRPFSAITGRDDNGDLDFQNDYPAGEGRNARRGPRFFQADLGLDWRLTRPDNVGVAAVVNIYNVFNTVNGVPSSVQNNVTSQAFGSPLAAYAPRQVEVGLRVDL